MKKWYLQKIVNIKINNNLIINKNNATLTKITDMQPYFFF